jgi:ABC-type sugar transport system ATPase subunit
VLLLDEPLSNLDALLRTSMRGELKQIQRRLAVTTLYVTHDQTEAMTLGDRIAVLKDGDLQQTGSPDDIYHQPRNRFVAGFIGTPPMNLLDGDILKNARRALVIPDIEDLTRVQLGLRPEHVRITTADAGLLQARLELVTSLGSETLLYLDLEGRQVLAKSTVPVDFNEKQSVGIDFDADNLFLFDKEKGTLVKK